MCSWFVVEQPVPVCCVNEQRVPVCRWFVNEHPVSVNNCEAQRQERVASRRRTTFVFDIIDTAAGAGQWSFRGGTRGNAVPIVKITFERMGTAFPLLSYGENAYILLKMHFAVQKDVFLTLKYGKTRWRPRLHPGPRWGGPRTPLGELTTLPRSLVGWGGNTPPQTSPCSAPSELRFSCLRRLEFRAFGAQFWRSHCIVNLRNNHCLAMTEASLALAEFVSGVSCRPLLR